MKSFRSIALLACAALAACGGGGGSSAVSPTAPVATATPAATKTASVTISVAIPAKIGSSAARSPRYVSPGTAAVQIAVNGGAAQTFAVSSGTPCSTAVSTISGTCTVYSVNAPVGSDTFAVSLLDAAGHVLSSGSTTATIAENVTNTVNITFNGVVASLRIALSNPSPVTGTNARIAVTLLPLDASGYTIVGSPGTLPSITVTDVDSTSGTGLYLVGSDGTCNTQAAAPTSSVTTTQSGAQYAQVCLAYRGNAIPNGATITGTIAGSGQQGSVTLSPSAPATSSSPNSGVWVLTYYTQTGETLERLDSNLNPVQAISGSNTVFGSEQSSSIAVLPASGNVAVLTRSGGARAIAVYASTASGNVAPISVTTLPTAAAGDAVAVDASNNAFTVLNAPANPSVAGSSDVCTIYRTPIVNGAGTSSAAGNCSNIVANQISVGIASGPNGYIYLSTISQVTNGTPPTDSYSIFRYVENSDGTLTAEAAITLANNASINGIAFDANGNIVVASYSANALLTYAASSFVTGQNMAVSPIASNPNASSNGYIAIDAAGNTYIANAGLSVIPSGSTSLAHSVSINPSALAAPTTAAPTVNASALSASPTGLTLNGSAQSVTVSESGYTGPITQTNTCSGVATVTPTTSVGPSAIFNVAPGAQGGTCAITFTDGGNVHLATTTVGNTATVVTGQSVRRTH